MMRRLQVIGGMCLAVAGACGAGAVPPCDGGSDLRGNPRVALDVSGPRGGAARMLHVRIEPRGLCASGTWTANSYILEYERYDPQTDLWLPVSSDGVRGPGVAVTTDCGQSISWSFAARWVEGSLLRARLTQEFYDYVRRESVSIASSWVELP